MARVCDAAYTMKRVVLVGAASALGLCSAARAELIVSLYTGTSQTHSSNLQLRQSGSESDAEFQGVHWQARPFEDAPYYGVRISYFPRHRPRVGASLDFTHYKLYAETERVVAVRGTWDGAPVDETTRMNTRVSDFEVSHGVNLTSLNVHYRWHTARGTSSTGERWHPHVGGGIVAYLPHAEGTINDVPASGDYQFAGFGYQLLAGTEYRLAGRLSLLLETKFDAGRLDIDLDPQTRAVTRVRTVHMLAGIALHFDRLPGRVVHCMNRRC